MDAKGASKPPPVPRTEGEWRRWLGGEVLPYWASALTGGAAGRPNAGYVEQLTPSGAAESGAEWTTLVTARLVYSFSHAHVLGLGAQSLAAAEHGYRFLVERCWDGAEGGFFRAVDGAGAAVDGGKHAYDAAFVLLAMAWHHRATGRREPLDWARRTVDWLDATLRDPVAGGFRPYRVAAGAPERCELNGQMHFLEACHALYGATGADSWLARADEMVWHLERNLLDDETGSLAELYGADWRPAHDAAGRLCEPGNNFEVAWMLHNHARLTRDRRPLAAADRLFRFARSRGFELEPQLLPAVFAAVERGGAIVNGTKPLWAQTEAVKAALARFETYGDVAAARFACEHLATIFARYLIDGTSRWRPALARDGSEIAAAVPVRVLYHLVICYAEAMRLWPDLAGAADPAGPELREPG